MNIEELEKLYDKASDEYDKHYDNIPNNLNYKEYENYMSEVTKKITDLNRKIRLIKNPTFSPISDYGHVMSLKNFISNVKSGGFIDYDGFGRYVRNNEESDITILPSDIKHKSIRKDFDTIIWFNK
jgi:hypothetical protein